jgi:hypothetical protein
MYAIDLTGIGMWIESNVQGIAEKVFIDKIPKALPTNLATYLYLQLNGRVMDYGAFKRLSATINVVAKDRQPGYANKTEINRMVNEVLAKLPLRDDENGWVASMPSVQPSRTITGFSYASITVTIQINK